MAAQELARWTRFAAKGGVGRCTATVDCVAREIGDLMFLKDDEITVLMQLPETGYYLGFCEGVVGRFSGTDVKFHGKLKRPIMAKRGSLGVADTRPMSLERASPSWPENSSGARAGSSNANRPGSSVARADSASDSHPGGSPVRRKPLSPDMYLYSSSPERLREYERTRGRAQELTTSVSGSSAYSAVSTSSAASTTFSDGDGWGSNEDSFLSSRVVPSSSSGLVQASSSTKSVPTSSSSMDSMPTSSPNSIPATSSAQFIPSLGSTHTSTGSVEKLLRSLSNHSPSMSQSTSGSISTSASEAMSGTFLNSSSTYGSLTSAPTSNSSSSSTNFATNTTKGLTVAPLRLIKSPRLTASPMLPPLSPLLPPPGSGTTSRAHSPLPSRSPLLASFTLPAKSSPPRSPLPPPPQEIPQSPPSPPSPPSTASSDSNLDADDSSLYLDDDHDHGHDESTQFSTLNRHLVGAEEEEDGETGIGLSLLGALAMDDEDEEDELANGYGDRPRLEVGAGRDLGDRAEESTVTDASTPIPWTKYTPSFSAAPTVEHEVDSNAPHASFETETMQDDVVMQVDEPGEHLERESEVDEDKAEEDKEEKEEEEDDDEEGYWARASDIYDDYRYSRHSFSSKHMSTISVKSKAHMSGLLGGGKVPPIPSFSPDRLSFDALSRPSVSSGRPSVSSTSSRSQPDRANIPSTYTHATASVYSRPSFESTSSVDPGSPVSLEHAPHGPVDGPEVRLRPPVARQFSGDHESTRTLSTYSVQALSPLSAQFPQVPTGVPSRLRVTNVDMEDESEGEGVGLGGEKAPPHAMNPVSPLLYASFGANGRHSGYTEETEMQSSGYSESDDGHMSRKPRGLRSDAGSLRSPVSPTDGFSAVSALRTRTESGREQRVGLGMRLVVDDDDDDRPVVDADVGIEGDTSFVSSEAGTASTGHTVTPASLVSPTGVPSALMPRAPAALTPGSPFTPTSGVSLTPVTPPALSPGALLTGNSPSGQDAPPPSTLRPRQPNQAPHPFSRTSIFLPHPNAPKIAPGNQGLGPMYARPQHPTANPGSMPPVQPPPNATAFSAQVLRHLRSISLGPGVSASVRRPPVTLYARCEPDLNSSAGPVPIMFSMDPLPPSQARTAHPGVTAPLSMAPVSPTRAATVPAPIRRSSAAPAAVGPLRGVPPPNSAKDASPNPSADPIGTSPLRLPRRSATTLAGTQEPIASSGAPVAPISRPNFVPRVGAARPRSRSFSGFGEAGNVGALPERSREEPVSKAQSVSVTAASVSTSSPASQPASMPAPTPNGLPASLRARHIPSPLSLQNGNLNRERSPTTIVSSADTPSPNAGQLKSPVTPGFQQLSIPSATKFGLQPPSAGSSSASPAPSFDPSNFSDRDKDSSPASAMTGRTSVSTNNVTSPHPWVSNVRHGSLDIPRKNSIDSAPPRQSSESTDSRSQMASPPPIAEWYSQSARSSPLTHEVQLRGKLSLPALRSKMSIKSKLDDAASVTSSLDNQESETVQVQDMDFELVYPTLPQVPLGRSSQESSYAGRDADAVHLDSPGAMQGDAVSMHSSAPRSPMFPDAISSDTPPVESPTSIDAHRQREIKWMALLPMVPPSQARRNKKVKRLLLDGVPSSVRYLVWCHLSDSKARAIPGVYARLGKRQRVPAFSDIEKDAKTYFPDQTQLHPFDGPLVSLLQAYLNMVPDIQYSSGLTSIAGHLLLLSPEEDAFWIFASMMDAHLRPYFSANTIQLEVDAALLSKAIEANDPAVCKKLYVTLSIAPSVIAKSWFSTLFVGTLPVDHLHRIWDVFLYEGVTLLFRVGLALVQCVRHLLLQATSEEAAMEYLVHPPLACLPSTADAFLNQALMMKLRDDDVRKQRIKMEAQIKRQTQSRTNGSSGMQTASISLPKTS